MRFTSTALIVLGILATGLAAWWVFAAPQSAQAGGLLPYSNPAETARGQALYSEHCASCHGSALEGEQNWRIRDADGYLPAPPHDPMGHTWHHPDAQLFEITKLGTEAIVGGGYKSRMIGFADVLSDAEILATLAYIKSTWPRQIIERHNQINATAD